MTLVLQGITLNDEPMSQPLIGRFDERGGTLGRSDNATFTLPDPERLISRVQAQVLFRDEGYWIENVSTANSTLHNGRALSAGMRILLHEGDELRIGGYTLVAAFENDETSATILRGRTVIMQPQGPPTRPRVAALPLDFAAEVTHTFDVPGAAPTPQKYERSAWQVFLRGAGIDLPPHKDLSPEFLRDVGALLTTSMRVALEAVLERFDPAKVDAAQYQSIRDGAREDFQRLFAEAFRQAYEAQVRGVKAANEPAASEPTAGGVGR